MHQPQFPTDLLQIENRVKEIDPVKYGLTRNFENGALSYLSPYISRGVISTLHVLNHIRTLDLKWEETEKLIQELAWRDYFQQVWIAKGDAIKADLKNEQNPVRNHEMSLAVANAETGIDKIDEGINILMKSGYMHNHMRMYVASISCNMAQSHWLQPAKWMYSHLLDGDLASNFLSWQWVAGAFSNKKYFANQDNINKYFRSAQKNTFIDVPYSDFENLTVPPILENTIAFTLETNLPKLEKPKLDQEKKTLIYNYYNMDPYWYREEDFQRVLLLEPSFFKAHPITQKCVDFLMALRKNIDDIQVYIGEFSELEKELSPNKIYFKEHPTVTHYSGNEEPRQWMTNVKGYYPSFFAFWKKCKKEFKI